LDQTVQGLGLCKTSIGLKTSHHAGLKGIDMSEPVAYQQRTRPNWKDETCWTPWEDCSKTEAEDCWNRPQVLDWLYEARALYTTPPQRTWVGLTYAEKHELRYSHMTSAEFIDAIEARLKEKNT
jgi:hypothetical protein